MTIFSDKLQLLWQNAFFDEFFNEFLTQLNTYEDLIEKKVYFKKSFEYLCSDPIFEQVLEHKCALNFAKALSTFIESNDIFESLGFNGQNFINSQHASVYFSLFTLQEDFLYAKFYLKYADTNLATYQKTIQKIIDADLIDALDFLCSNLNNIHYNDFALLDLVKHSPNCLILLIKKHDFNINFKRSKNNLSFLKENLLLHDFKTIKPIFEHAIDRIAVQLKISPKTNEDIYNFAHKNNLNELSLIDIIRFNKWEKKLFPFLLKFDSLSEKHFTEIGECLFQHENISSFEEMNLYHTFFQNPLFDPAKFNLGQRYFLFGFYSLIGDLINEYKTAAPRYVIDSMKNALTLNHINEAVLPYKTILNNYFEFHADKEVGSSPHFHIVGAAVYITKYAQCSNMLDVLETLLRNLPEYINTPNPNGYMCIDMVPKNSTLYTILKNHGAIDTPKENSLFKKFLMNSVFKSKSNKHKDNIIQSTFVDVNKIEEKLLTTSPFNIQKIRLKMREDLKKMRTYIAIPECDPIIKIECENMFLKAEKIAQYIEKNKITNCYDEFHFLNENFSNYLKESLQSYTNIAKNRNELLGVGTQDRLDKKLHEAHEICVKHIQLLNEQTQLIADNLLLNSNESNLQNLKARTYFLNEKFKETNLLLAATNEIPELSIKTNKSKEKNSALELNEDLLNFSYKDKNINEILSETDTYPTPSSNQINLFDDIEEQSSTHNDLDKENSIK